MFETALDQLSAQHKHYQSASPYQSRDHYGPISRVFPDDVYHDQHYATYPHRETPDAGGFHQQFPSNGLPTIAQDAEFDPEEEDISDEFSEGELDEIARFQNGVSSLGTPSHQNKDTTQQLLQFADRVNGDIQKYFGRNKGQGDFCDIYDEVRSKKSGREQYYADLLKIAQGMDVVTTELTNGGGSPDEEQTRDTFSGKLQPDLGLGPLDELFQNKEQADEHNIDKTSLPMTKRSLPLSFWREPMTSSTKQTDDATARAPSPGGDVTNKAGLTSQLLGQTKAPDFSDLLESWTREVGCSVADTGSANQH